MHNCFLHDPYDNMGTIPHEEPSNPTAADQAPEEVPALLFQAPFLQRSRAFGAPKAIRNKKQTAKCVCIYTDRHIL